MDCVKYAMDHGCPISLLMRDKWRSLCTFFTRKLMERPFFTRWKEILMVVQLRRICSHNMNQNTLSGGKWTQILIQIRFGHFEILIRMVERPRSNNHLWWKLYQSPRVDWFYFHTNPIENIFVEVTGRLACYASSST
jgi:hypothetical protein